MDVATWLACAGAPIVALAIPGRAMMLSMAHERSDRRVAVPTALVAARLRGAIGRPAVLVRLKRAGGATPIAMSVATAALRRT